MKVYYYASGSWTEITKIVAKPKIITILDNTGFCSVTIRDFEGALYATWSAFEKIPMKVEDDSSNIIFSGSLFNKKFHANDLTIEIRGFSHKVEDALLETNYMKFDGRIKQVVNETELIIEEQDSEGDWAEVAWAVNEWSTGDQDCAVMIRDNNPWTEKAFTVQNNGVATDADSSDVVAAKAQTVNNGTYMMVQSTNDHDAYLTVNIENAGAAIANTKKINRIELYYRIGCACDTNFLSTVVTLEIYNYDSSTWETLPGTTCSNWHYPAGPATWLPDTGLNKIVLNGDYTDYMHDGGVNFDYITVRLQFDPAFPQLTPDNYGYIDYLSATIYHDDNAFSLITEKITSNDDTNNLICSGATFQSDGIHGSSEGGYTGDLIKIGVSSKNVLRDIGSKSGLGVEIDLTNDKYVSSDYSKGIYCIKALRDIAQLHNAKWYEDHTTSVIGIKNVAEFTDSAVDLTSADYGHDFEFEDKCNAYKGVKVYGNAVYDVYAEAINASAGTYVKAWKTVIRANINTNAEAKSLADDLLAEIKTAQPSIKLSLDGVNVALELGMTVGITMERPTVAEDDYAIRMIQRSETSLGTHRTVIHAGLGHTEEDEKIANLLKRLAYASSQSLTDKLRATSNDEIPVMNHSQLNNITTSQHHVKYTDAEAAAKIAGDDLYAKVAGDTFTGLVTIDNLGLDSGADDFIINAPTAKTIYCKINSVEKMSLDTDRFKAQTHIQAKAAHGVYAFSSDDGAYISISHDGANAIIKQSGGSGGDFYIQDDTFFRDGAAGAWKEISADKYNEFCEALPGDPDNWKELLPDFVKSKKLIGENEEIAINVGMVARLALRENAELKTQVENLKLEFNALLKRLESPR